MANDYDILVIEDEPVVIEAAKKILLPENFTLDEALDAASALNKLQDNHYQLILSDLMLPKVSGFELIETVKRKYPHLPIIAITGYATLENAVQSLKMGAFDFIPKPFDLEELLGVVNRAMSFKKMMASPDRSEWHSLKARSGKYYFLGQHSWAKIDQDGSAILGVGETFAGVVKDVERIRVTPINEEICQGSVFAWITTKQNLVHMVWAPLSGKVIENNCEIEQDANLINTDPFFRGWLIRIIPTNLEGELVHLINRS